MQGLVQVYFFLHHLSMTQDQIRENRLRRMASRQRLALRASGRRDPHAFDYGLFMLIDQRTQEPVYGHHPHPYSATMDDIESYLTSDRE
jgi:hypothetical protein